VDNKNLIERLAHIQQVEDLTDADIALKLGIHEKSWNKIKNGKMIGGAKFLKGVAKSYPGLDSQINEYLRGTGNDKTPQN
jgi:transcriptional regulator with XRE-family HTH domain